MKIDEIDKIVDSFSGKLCETNDLLEISNIMDDMFEACGVTKTQEEKTEQNRIVNNMIKMGF